jgi:hypothetical protein
MTVPAGSARNSCQVQDFLVWLAGVMENVGHILTRRDPALLPARGAAEVAEATRLGLIPGQLLSINVPFRDTDSPSPRLWRLAPSKVRVPLRRPAP